MCVFVYAREMWDNIFFNYTIVIWLVVEQEKKNDFTKAYFW